MRPNRVKHALYDGKVQIGTWITTLRSPHIVQMLATSGFDFIYIDMEHSSFSIETVGDLCLAALGANMVPIVRPQAKEHHLLSKPLDVGAMGLLVPHVETREDAEEAVRAIKYPPLGDRSLSGRGIHTGFGRARTDEYLQAANRETLLIVQIESDWGVRNLDSIVAVEGVDGAVVGRGDLSAGLGLPGQTERPEVTARVEMMISACQRHHKIPGLMVGEVDAAKEWIAKGIRLLPYSTEVAMLVETASRATGEIRGFSEG